MLARVARDEMEAIDVLRDQSEALSVEGFFHRNNGSVTVIGLRRTANAAPIEVPGPHRLRFTYEHGVSGHLLRVVFL